MDVSGPKTNTEVRRVRTTVDLPDGMLDKACKLLGTKTKREAIERALEDAMRAARADEIRAKLGTYRIDMTREDILRLREMD